MLKKYRNDFMSTRQWSMSWIELNRDGEIMPNRLSKSVFVVELGDARVRMRVGGSAGLLVTNRLVGYVRESDAESVRVTCHEYKATPGGNGS
jgi:hypothetical protein